MPWGGLSRERTRYERPSRMLKNAHLRRCPHPSSLRRTFKYASLLRSSGALHLAIFEHPAKAEFFSNPLRDERAYDRVLTGMLAERRAG